MLPACETHTGAAVASAGSARLLVAPGERYWVLKEKQESRKDAELFLSISFGSHVWVTLMYTAVPEGLCSVVLLPCLRSFAV